ncbi:MAG TPA: UbiA-like polyprenyltransferase [Tepidisphaeraceae bacterium]|jgi:4-hydroxybenzoate polyprenyltransferase
MSTIALPISPSQKLRIFAADIKISHTLFALPWALLAMFLAAGEMPKISILLLILGCMVTARTFAMAANRLFDAKFDAINPRTARRAIPAGLLSRDIYIGVLIFCGIAFILLASGFWFLASNPWPLILAVPVLAYVAGYPFLKRFTRLCHYYLGGALALAPVCAYLAIKGRVDLPPLLMFATVFTWTAGFDIIYACQDYSSDRATGIFSVPAKVGIGNALWIARITHLFSAFFIIFLGYVTPAFGALYFVGAAAAILLLVIEHSLVHADDLSKVNLAFFTINGIISVGLCTLGTIDIFLR